MESTFVKNINGYSVQFNRLLYPLHYSIKSSDPGSDGMKYIFKRNEIGVWTVGQSEVPKWLEEMGLDIHYLLEENEKTLK